MCLIVKIRCFSFLNISFVALLMVYVLLIIEIVCHKGGINVKEIGVFILNKTEFSSTIKMLLCLYRIVPTKSL